MIFFGFGMTCFFLQKKERSIENYNSKKIQKMSVKKINGYKIFLGEELGKGSFAAVRISFYKRFTKGSRINPKSSMRSKLSIKKTVKSFISDS